MYQPEIDLNKAQSTSSLWKHMQKAVMEARASLTSILSKPLNWQNWQLGNLGRQRK